LQINAADAASSSDAHFFYLSSVTTKTNDNNLQLKVKSATDGIGFVSLAAYQKKTKQNKQKTLTVYELHFPKGEWNEAKAGG
jgi:hypothetical protein